MRANGKLQAAKCCDFVCSHSSQALLLARDRLVHLSHHHPNAQQEGMKVGGGRQSSGSAKCLSLVGATSLHVTDGKILDSAQTLLLCKNWHQAEEPGAWCSVGTWRGCSGRMLLTGLLCMGSLALGRATTWHIAPFPFYFKTCFLNINIDPSFL